MHLIPPPLVPGDKIAVVAPAGNLFDQRRYHLGCSIISDMGFELVSRDKKWPGTGYLSDSDDNRLKEFHSVWLNPEIKAVFTLRGGYGSLRLIDKLDVSVVQKNPKTLIGFSDITILLNHLYFKTGIISLHGPVFSTLGNSDQETLERLYHCLTGKWHNVLSEKIEIIRNSSTKRGRLLGGNLSSLATLLGTSWDPDFSGCILFLEDVNEPYYRLDRLLTQFHLNGKLNNVAGIILGDFSDGDDIDKTERLRRHEFVWERVRELTSGDDIPIWGGFPSGHCKRNITLPIGAYAIMDSSAGTLGFDIP